MKIYHGGPGYKEDERMHWLSKKRYKIGLVIPTLDVYMVFIIIPIGMSIGYSFTKYSGIGKATFNGLTNYMRLFKDRLFWISLKNTMIMFILAFVLLLSLSFLIALLLNNKLKGVDFSKSLIFSPAIIAPIIVGIIWVYILDPNIGIINNVLDMSRIDSGKVELDEDYVKIRDIYQGIYKIFQAEAEKKCIHLKMEYDVKHEHVICDETKNKEIFLNLISNAVKYTASGGTVTIRITEIDCDREDCVRIQTQVIDTGIGMREEFLPSLFEAFARERNTTAAKDAGTGLGMPIIKKYIDMMYGTIEVESKQGEGSKFTVTLEYRIADKSYYEQDTEKSSDVDETDRISGKHILLAEDNDLNAEIAQFILEDMGLMVDRVEDGVQCVSRIEQKPAGTYDLILMDIQMPNMDGNRATEKNRGLSDKDHATIPIIAMTANAFEEDRKKALAKGMNGHIAKPVDAEKVEKTICSVLGSQSEQ